MKLLVGLFVIILLLNSIFQFKMAALSEFKEIYMDPYWAVFLEKLQANSPFSVAVFGGFVAMMLTYYIYGFACLFVDIKHIPETIYKHRYQKTRPYIWQGSAYNPAFLTMIRNVVLNQFLVILPGLFLMDFAANYVRSLNVLPWSPGIRISNELPELPEVLVKSVLSVLLVEVNFYVSHRLLHVPWLYARIHKIHHAYKAPHAFAAIYAHPIEALVGNTFAVMGPAFFLGFHLSHWMLGVVVGWLSTMTSHSGYKMPFPFARLLSTPHFHDLHHEFFNYNYGTLGYLDYLFGTKMERVPKNKQTTIAAEENKID